jgi:hypothetical protein
MIVMQIKLDDDEIREILAEAISKKIDYSIIDIDPNDCFFEFEAIKNTEIELEDIHSVKFCYQTPK